MKSKSQNSHCFCIWNSIALPRVQIRCPLYEQLNHIEATTIYERTTQETCNYMQGSSHTQQYSLDKNCMQGCSQTQHYSLDTTSNLNHVAKKSVSRMLGLICKKLDGTARDADDASHDDKDCNVFSRMISQVLSENIRIVSGKIIGRMWLYTQITHIYRQTIT